MTWNRQLKVVPDAEDKMMHVVVGRHIKTAVAYEIIMANIRMIELPFSKDREIVGHSKPQSNLRV